LLSLHLDVFLDLNDDVFVCELWLLCCICVGRNLEKIYYVLIYNRLLNECTFGAADLKYSEIKAFAIKNDAGPLMNTEEDEDNRANGY
jgi:hypothetical protein